MRDRKEENGRKHLLLLIKLNIKVTKHRSKEKKCIYTMLYRIKRKGEERERDRKKKQ